MPEKFNRCVRVGGKVRTLKPKGKSSPVYKKVCYPKGGGKPVAGHTAHRKSK